MIRQELIKHYEVRINNLRREIIKLKAEVELIEAFIIDVQELRLEEVK